MNAWRYSNARRVDADASLGVVAVHVEDRRLDHLGDVGRVGGRAAGVRSGREADQVVDDDVHRSAGAVAGQLAEVEGLGHDALAGERRVAVQQHGQDLVLGLVAEQILLRARHALDDRIDGLEVRRVRREDDGDVVAGARREASGHAEVVLDVARALDGVGVDRRLRTP